MHKLNLCLNLLNRFILKRSLTPISHLHELNDFKMLCLFQYISSQICIAIDTIFCLPFKMHFMFPSNNVLKYYSTFRCLGLICCCSTLILMEIQDLHHIFVSDLLCQDWILKSVLVLIFQETYRNSDARIMCTTS